jgi:cysteine desulfurase family protein (TIGR01976 family)
MDLTPLRTYFPALRLADSAGRPYVFFDGPGGTQATDTVIAAMSDYLTDANANRHGDFITSRRTEETIARAREAAADLLNAPSPRGIVFGQNMTSLTFHLSETIGRELKPGDEVVVTHLDHDANIAPWTRLQAQGVVVRWADFHPEDCTLDLEGLKALLNERTRLVAVGYASNAVGTINDVARIAAWAHEMGAWCYVDSVHYAPHGPIDVQALGCDFLVCSAYKFFGPHMGVLWGREDLLERMRPAKVRPASDDVPDRYETGTANHEGLAGLAAAVDYLAEVGRRYGGPFLPQYTGFEGRRLALKTGLAAIQQYERGLCWQLIEGLQRIPGLHIHGITEPARAGERAPTVSFTMDKHPAPEISAYLADAGIFTWAGNFYALAVTERLRLEDKGGLLRVGLVHYNTTEEVGRLVGEMEGLE